MRRRVRNPDVLILSLVGLYFLSTPPPHASPNPNMPKKESENITSLQQNVISNRAASMSCFVLWSGLSDMVPDCVELASNV